MKEKYKYLEKINILEEEIKNLREQVEKSQFPIEVKKTYISFEERKEKVLKILRKYHPKPVNVITIKTEGKLKPFVVNIVLDDLLFHDEVRELYGSWKNSFLGEDERKHKVGRLFILKEEGKNK